MPSKIIFFCYYFSKQEYEIQSMTDEYKYSRLRHSAETFPVSRITNWDINDSIIPKVKFDLL